MPAALFEVTNDEHLAMYISALGRSVVALHELSNNKIKHKELERAEGNAPAAEGKKEDKEGDKAAAAGDKAAKK